MRARARTHTHTHTHTPSNVLEGMLQWETEVVGLQALDSPSHLPSHVSLGRTPAVFLDPIMVTCPSTPPGAAPLTPGPPCALHWQEEEERQPKPVISSDILGACPQDGGSHRYRDHCTPLSGTEGPVFLLVPRGPISWVIG